MPEGNDKSPWVYPLIVIAVIAGAFWMNRHFEKKREIEHRNGPVLIIDTGNAQQNIRDADAMREYLHSR